MCKNTSTYVLHTMNIHKKNQDFLSLEELYKLTEEKLIKCY